MLPDGARLDAWQVKLKHLPKRGVKLGRQLLRYTDESCAHSMVEGPIQRRIGPLHNALRINRDEAVGPPQAPWFRQWPLRHDRVGSPPRMDLSGGSGGGR